MPGVAYIVCKIEIIAHRNGNRIQFQFVAALDGQEGERPSSDPRREVGARKRSVADIEGRSRTSRNGS